MIAAPANPPHTVRLSDYRPFGWRIEDVHLTFRLDPKRTRVLSRIRFAPDAGAAPRLRLDGEGLKLISARIDGRPVTPEVDDEGLSVDVPPAPFTWEAEVEIAPEDNTALEGLYMSGGIYCTQCEAEGFRRITYYPDRPDVMAPFTVRIEGDAPVLLSNGNPMAEGPGWAEWHDPWPKPSYLFALVAGDLIATSGSFRTADGRDVALNIWVRPGDEDRTSYALDSLIRAMRWDEERYGRVYDLNVFNLVAVADFNAGAMENKGLNIFNSKYVLASPETATDGDFEGIESVVAHEYFHNWTGNRITCRDWFQLCLKEGLTVYRDQEFTSDMRSRAVKRIEDALLLRSAQFREDAGPLAHPPRPDTYVEINNFYTATVYEKGAEIVRMLHTILGDDAFQAGIALYFDRHDGDAATIEEFFACFQEVSAEPLDGFETWWTQAGTPRLSVSRHWDGETLTVSFRQSTPPTPGQDEKAPLWLPLRVAVLAHDGAGMGAEEVIVLRDTEEHWSWDRASGKWALQDVAPSGQAVPVDMPILSLNRGFSAPILVESDISAGELQRILAFDSDPFARWDAGRQLVRDEFVAAILDERPLSAAVLDGLRRVVTDASLDPAFRALALTLPSDTDMAQTLFEARMTPDPQAIRDGRRRLRQAIAAHLALDLDRLYEEMHSAPPYSPDAASSGRRALRTRALAFLGLIEGPERARALFRAADNMTERLAALGTLLDQNAAEAELSDFHEMWRGTAGVIDKWFAMQVGHAEGRDAVDVAERLAGHPDFDWRVPNRVRSVAGTLVRNHTGFHAADGGGYRIVADWILHLDPINPSIAAGLAGGFHSWKRYDGDRQGMMRDALERIARSPGLSRDTGEMVARILRA